MCEVLNSAASARPPSESEDEMLAAGNDDTDSDAEINRKFPSRASVDAAAAAAVDSDSDGDSSEMEDDTTPSRHELLAQTFLGSNTLPAQGVAPQPPVAPQSVIGRAVADDVNAWNRACVACGLTPAEVVVILSVCGGVMCHL